MKKFLLIVSIVTGVLFVAFAGLTCYVILAQANVAGGQTVTTLIDAFKGYLTFKDTSTNGISASISIYASVLVGLVGFILLLIFSIKNEHKPVILDAVLILLEGIACAICVSCMTYLNWIENIQPLELVATILLYVVDVLALLTLILGLVYVCKKPQPVPAEELVKSDISVAPIAEVARVIPEEVASPEVEEVNKEEPAVDPLAVEKPVEKDEDDGEPIDKEPVVESLPVEEEPVAVEEEKPAETAKKPAKPQPKAIKAEKKEEKVKTKPVAKKEEKKVTPAKKEEKKPVAKAAAKPAAKPVSKPTAKPIVKDDKNLGRVYHISQSPNQEGYQVKLAGGEKAIGIYPTQKEAIDKAKDLVSKNGGKYLVHSLKGKIRKA